MGHKNMQQNYWQPQVHAFYAGVLKVQQQTHGLFLHAFNQDFKAFLRGNLGPMPCSAIWESTLPTHNADMIFLKFAH